MKNKQERTVVHVEISGLHFYFGVALGTLRNYRVTSDKSYQNSKCIIRKGILVTVQKSTV